MLDPSSLPRPIIRFASGIWRRRWTVITVAWITAILGWIAVFLLPDQYESRAHVFVQTETILEPVLNGFTARPDYSERVDVMRLQLLTRPNVEEIILRSGIDRLIEANSPNERRAKLETMINWVSARIRIDSPRDLYFVISYKDKDPEVSRDVVDAVLNLLIEQDLGASLSESEAARRRLNLQIEEFEEKLVANEREVAEFRRRNGAELATSTGAERRRELKESELVRLNDELERTKGRILTLQNLLSATPRSVTGGELDRLRVELADLRSRYNEDHPDIRGVVARIDQLENGGSLSSNPEYVRLRSELSVARDSIGVLEARQNTLRDELEQLDVSAGQAPAAEAELRQIIREYEQTQKTYEELLARRDRLDLTRNLGAAGRGVEYQIFERPQKAVIPTDPPRMLFVLAVFVIALGAGVGLAMLLTVNDKSYSQSAELQEAFGLPVLGAISEVGSVVVKQARARDARRLAIAFLALVFVGVVYLYATVLRAPSGTELEQAYQDTGHAGVAL